ncbi:MBL fold metallo-hydrolase [bacterium]|nr:MBL fold metallo-hydrolase [bacterium]
MIFRQLFDHESSTYTYLLGDANSGEALLIDPVIANTDSYLSLLQQLSLTLKLCVDTHTHADHITALGALRERTGCITMMGEQAMADCVSQSFAHLDQIEVGSIKLQVLYTPGHTDDSYSFYVPDAAMLFTGDTLLIRGTGRTDFQNGDALAQYHSLHELLLKLPEHTEVYPAHDYKGWSKSSIREERQHNPRLQVSSAEDYAAIMAALKLPNPKLMDIAVPANQACGESGS